MTYNKPKDVTYVEMCMYFDAHIYDDPEKRNDELLFQYLYLILYMLACKARFFSGYNSWKNYDDFAIYGATKIYTRYINPKHQAPEDRLVSVLNYCNSVLDHLKVDFQKETFNEIIGDKNNENAFYKLQNSMEEAVQASYCDNKELMQDIFNVFKHIREIIKEVVGKTPYVAEPITCKRLEMSILLTLLNQMTLPTNIDKRQVSIENKYTLLKRTKTDDIILWRLSNSYRNLVHILTVETKKQCSKQVGIIRADYELDSDDVTAILMTAYGNVARDDNEEF